MKFIIIALILLAVFSLDNGVGRTPPMGWNSWNRFGCNINQTLIRQTADLLVSLGLAEKGYRYVNLDDCWQIERNSSTKEIIQDRTKFPSGIAKLAEYVHSKNLLFGLYSDAGQKTCQGRPGGLGYQTIDANTYAKWQIDYLKYDNCYNNKVSSRVRYPPMRDALNKSGRHIFFSMCQWGQQSVWIWANPVGNSWRTTGDISNKYDSFVSILDKQIGLSRYAGPGGWNDPDMLQVGNGGMTYDQYQSHFALWAALKAPLLIGCGLTGITKQTLTILGNTQVIAINQDSLGKQADLIKQQKEVGKFYRQIWGGPLSDNRFVYVCFNRDSKQTVFQLNFAELLPTVQVINIRQVIDHIDVKVPESSILTTKAIRSHAVGVYVVGYKQKKLQV